MTATADSRQSNARGNIAYVLSLKGGMPSFNYREIEAMGMHGFSAFLYPTKTSPGVYVPKHEWYVFRPSVLKGLISWASWLARAPKTLLSLTWLAIMDRGLPELSLAVQFARHMSKVRARIIHCHFADRKMFTAYFSSALSGIPFIVTLHSHELTLYTKRRLFARALEACSRVITVCDFNRSTLLEKTSVSPDKVVTIGLNAPLDSFVSDERARVLTVAKFHEYKGYDTLMTAARIMRDDPVVFWIVGEGPLDVSGMAADLVETGKVRFLGSVNEETLKILYQSCDIFCLPSRTASSGQKEGLPVSLMEAMSFSKPVVTTKHAGIPELVKRIIVEENNPEAVAEALRSYVIEPEMRRTDGESNRRVLEERHGEASIEMLIDLVESTSRPS